MRSVVIKHNLRPCVRSVYKRVAFQSPEHNELRLTVDRDVTLIDESAANNSGMWCLDDDCIEPRMTMKKVPNDIFEVKLSGAVMPSAIGALLKRGIILDATKFSKFLTGAAAFNVNEVGLLPYWAKEKAFSNFFFPKHLSCTDRFTATLRPGNCD